MNYPKHTKLEVGRRQVVAGLLFLVLCLGSLPVTAQNDLPDPVANLFAVGAGAYIIPMDTKQNTESSNTGNCAANTNLFNLKAYGLVQRLLQANVPVFWAIAANKAKDGNDFTATAARIYPTGIAAGSVNFSGGPFVIPPSSQAAALTVINSFRAEVEPAAFPTGIADPTNCDDAAASRVNVYQATAPFVIDLRHVLSHKPTPVYGAANGGFGGNVHIQLFETARITGYGVVDDNTVSPQTCSTIAVQPHSESPDAFVDNYRAFVESGGNLLLQCASVTSFENSIPDGFFQTTAGWTSSTTDTLFATPYPNPDMPFGQFIGAITPSQTGAVEDWQLNGGALQNGTFAVVQSANNGGAARYMATVSKVGNVGRRGGMVFELGGHNYFWDDSTGISLTAAKYNAQRMILNSLFVPVTRPAECGVQLGSPQILGFKSVKLGSVQGDDLNGNGVANPGDTVVWSIFYANIGTFPSSNFQITDTIPANTTYVNTPNPQPVVTVTGVGTAAAANTGYTGSGNLLMPNAVLDVGGVIRVDVRTKINLNVCSGGCQLVANQAFATGTDVQASVPTDNVDSNPINQLPPGIVIPPGSELQDEDVNFIEPTTINLAVPTAADVFLEGRAVGTNGRGLSGISVTLTDANTGQRKTAVTNTFGFFRFDDLEIGDLYILSAFNKRYSFAELTFTLDDNMTGVTLVGTPR